MSASKSTLASDASTLSLWLKPEKRGIAISIAVLAILLTTFAYLIRQSPALPEAVKPSHIDKRETSQVNYGELVRNRLAIANRDAGIATKSFEAGLRKIILINWPNLITASNSAAETVGSYDAMCNTVYYLAWDSVNGGEKTDVFLDEAMRAFIEPPVETLNVGINQQVRKFETELRKISVQLAADLAAIGPGDPKGKWTPASDSMSPWNIDEAIKMLGVKTTGNAVGIGLNLNQFGKNQVSKNLTKKIVQVAGRVLSKQATKAAGSAVIAFSDGPLPVGKIVAALGFIWTGYDIYTIQGDYQNDIRTSLIKQFQVYVQGAEGKANQYSRARLVEFETLNATISSKRLAALPK